MPAPLPDQAPSSAPSTHQLSRFGYRLGLAIVVWVVALLLIQAVFPVIPCNQAIEGLTCLGRVPTEQNLAIIGLGAVLFVLLGRQLLPLRRQLWRSWLGRLLLFVACLSLIYLLIMVVLSILSIVGSSSG